MCCILRACQSNQGLGGSKKIDGNRKKSIEIDEKADGENGRQKNSKKIDF
jgi:hypothetical protein